MFASLNPILTTKTAFLMTVNPSKESTTTDSLELSSDTEIVIDSTSNSKEVANSLFDPSIESDTAEPKATSEAILYTYQPGDEYKKIDNKSDVKILVLKQIYDSELSVKKRGEGLLVVFYEGEPIVEMRGIEFIQTENGVSPIENWMFT
jgi:hypothetical protein